MRDSGGQYVVTGISTWRGRRPGSTITTSASSRGRRRSQRPTVGTRVFFSPSTSQLQAVARTVCDRPGPAGPADESGPGRVPRGYGRGQPRRGGDRCRAVDTLPVGAAGSSGGRLREGWGRPARGLLCRRLAAEPRTVAVRTWKTPVSRPSRSSKPTDTGPGKEYCCASDARRKLAEQLVADEPRRTRSAGQ